VSNNKKPLDKLLKDRGNPYEIELELAIRKMLENNTDLDWEFRKNQDQYGYDLQANHYLGITGKSDWDIQEKAFIEVEVSENWENKWPDHWYNYSFLTRKIRKYDWDNNEFKDELKDNADKTIYIIFNKNLSDAFCQNIKTIDDKFNIIKQGNIKNESSYNNTYHRLKTKEGKYIVHRGVDECLSYIQKFINEKSDK